MVMAEEQTRMAGRKAEAARNDVRILEAAREVFLDDPTAPVSAVAERAGVGMSALYRRFGSKELMLRTLCHEGLRRYIAEAEAALSIEDGWDALAHFLHAVVQADVHSLTVRLAGTFEPTEEMGQDAVRAEELNQRLIAGARQSGRLREDIDVHDLPMILELMSAVRLGDAARIAELRRRYLTLLLDSMCTTSPTPLQDPPPGADELARRWEPGSRDA